MVSSRIQVPSWTWHELCCSQKHLGLDSCLFLTGWALLLPCCFVVIHGFLLSGLLESCCEPSVYLPGAHPHWVNTRLSPPALTTLFPSDVCQHHPETSDSSGSFSVGCGHHKTVGQMDGGVIIRACSPEKGTDRLCRQKSSRADVLAHCRLRSLSWPGNQHLRW